MPVPRHPCAVHVVHSFSLILINSCQPSAFGLSRKSLAHYKIWSNFASLQLFRFKQILIMFHMTWPWLCGGFNYPVCVWQTYGLICVCLRCKCEVSDFLSTFTADFSLIVTSYIFTCTCLLPDRHHLVVDGLELTDIEDVTSYSVSRYLHEFRTYSLLSWVPNNRRTVYSPGGRGTQMRTGEGKFKHESI